MEKVPRNVFYRNLANVASILGVLPMVLLFLPDGYRFLIPFILYNNVMDDLDGVLAGKLKIRSLFGANLDNVCDTVVHVTVILLVSAQFEGLVLAAGVIAATAVIVRLTSRLDPDASKSNGSPTNELMRHLLFVLLLTNQFGVSPEIYLIVLFLLHSVTMIAPFKMAFLIRGMARSATAVTLVNVALIGAWLLPSIAPYIAAIFIASYLYSFVTGSLGWLRRGNASPV
jgi:phosphatidylserine synthase